MNAALAIEPETESALQARTMAALVEAAFGGLLVHDFRHIVEANEEVARIYGYTAAEMIGMPVSRLIHPADVARMGERLRRPQVRYECRAERADGSLIHVEICAVTVSSERRVAAVRDITLRKTWETSVAESEERFRLLCQAAFDAVIVHEHGVVLTVNEKAARMFGYTPEEMYGRSILDFTSPSMHTTIRNQVRLRMLGAVASVGLRADGTEFPLEVCGVTQERTGLRIAALRDVSERKRAEDELRRREERFRVLVHAAFDGVAVAENDRIEEVNERFAEMFGYTADELRGMHISRVIPTATAGEGRSCGKGVRKDGSTMPIETCVGAAGDAQRIYAVRDVTVEKRDREQLIESERRYRELSESTHDLLCRHDLDGTLVEVNPAAARALGYTREELEGRRMQDFLDPSHADEFALYLERIARDGVAEGLMRVRTREGELRAWHYRNALHASGVDRPVVRGLARDVTEREVARAALNRSERHFRSIIENISDTITVLDAQGRIQYYSPSMARLLGYDGEELPARLFVDLLHPEDRRAAENFFAAQLEAPDESATLDARILHCDGSWRWLSMVTTSRREHATPTLIVNGRDVTERRLLLGQLEQANRVNSLGRLAATVAHEFNNVLMGMQPFAELMQRPGISQQAVAKGSGYIVNSIARGKSVALDILRFTQPAQPSLVPLDLASWWERLAPELQVWTGNNIRFEWDVPRDLVVLADAAQLSQVLSNLVSNARDAMRKGGSLRVSARRPAPRETFRFGVVRDPQNFVQISVSDTGVGMTDEVARHAFDPLFTTKQNGGTGLGLAVVHQVVARHGGSIFISTKPDEGTTFHLFLPCGPAATKAAGVIEDEVELRGLRVLLVDDERPIGEGLSAALESYGAVTALASGVVVAKKITEGFRPQAAVVDVKLQDGDGFVLGRELQSAYPGIKIVYASGHADPGNLAAGCAFLQKPFETSELVARLADLCAGELR